MQNNSFTYLVPSSFLEVVSSGQLFVMFFFLCLIVKQDTVSHTLEMEIIWNIKYRGDLTLYRIYLPISWDPTLLAFRSCWMLMKRKLNPSQPDVTMHILHTVLYTFPSSWQGEFVEQTILLQFMINFFILVTLMFDSGVIM